MDQTDVSRKPSQAAIFNEQSLIAPVWSTARLDNKSKTGLAYHS